MGMTRIGKVMAVALAGAMLCSAALQRGAPPAGEGLIALKAARLFDATSERLREDAVVLVRDGRIVGVGASTDIPAGTQIIDLGDATLLPGFIDAHSHLGASGSPAIPAHDDTNEATAPNAAEAWIEHSVWPQDPKFRLARAACEFLDHLFRQTRHHAGPVFRQQIDEQPLGGGDGIEDGAVHIEQKSAIRLVENRWLS